MTTADEPFVVVSNRQIYEKLEQLTIAVGSLPRIVEDHEKRIRGIEGKSQRLTGGLALIGPALALIVGAVGALAAFR